MIHLEHGVSAQSSTDDIWATGMDSPLRGGCSHMGPYEGHMGAIYGPYGGHMRPYGGGYCALMARPSERSRLRHNICYLPACAHSQPHMAALPKACFAEDTAGTEGRRLALAHVAITSAFSCYNIIFTKIDATLLAHTFGCVIS